MSDEPQTALMLTRQEWDDLTAMVTDSMWSRSTAESPDPQRRRALARRIIEANR